MRPRRAYATEKVYSAASSEVFVAYATHPGRVRAANEDSVGLPSTTDIGEGRLRAKGCLFLVADGVGGQSSGDVASRLAVQAAIRAYYATNREANARTALVAAFDSAHERVREASRQADRKGMATTLVGAVIRDGSAVVANVGDSRAYLWRKGTLTQLSRDHSLVAELVRRGALTEDEAKIHPHRHVITQSIGGEADISPTVCETALEQGDRLLLCTDGLTDVVGDDGISRIVGRPSLSGAAEALVKAALAAGGPDNVTVLLIESRRTEGASPPRSVLDHSATFPAFLGLGLLLVFVVLYLVARAALTPGVPTQPSPLPKSSPSLCNENKVARLAYYLEGKVTSVVPLHSNSACQNLLIGVVNSSGVLTFCVNTSGNDKYRPVKGDRITAAVRCEGPVVEALWVNVYKHNWILPWQQSWGNWIWDNENLSSLLLYASKIPERNEGQWTGLSERVSPPVLLSGQWQMMQDGLPVFHVSETYTWDNQRNCFSQVRP